MAQFWCIGLYGPFNNLPFQACAMYSEYRVCGYLETKLMLILLINFAAKAKPNSIWAMESHVIIEALEQLRHIISSSSL